jgi:hypothetical protein
VTTSIRWASSLAQASYTTEERRVTSDHNSADDHFRSTCTPLERFRKQLARRAPAFSDAHHALRQRPQLAAIVAFATESRVCYIGIGLAQGESPAVSRS